MYKPRGFRTVLRVAGWEDRSTLLINSISKVENLNYELLSDSGSFNLETKKNSIELAGQHSEYDLYLINGLGGKCSIALTTTTLMTIA